MKREAYAAARTVSPAVHDYFARHLEQAAGEKRLAPLPAAEAIEALIDAAFWASLRREEGFVPRISLAFLAPEHTGSDQEALRFERALAVLPGVLTRVAPAVERPGVHLGVWHEKGELYVWGTTRDIPKYCFVLEVAAPGLLVIKHHSGDEAGKFVNVAVLEGDEIRLIDEHAPELPDCPAMVSSLLGFPSPASWAYSVNVLVQLAVSMRAHGRGGALLVVPSGDEEWRESILSPMIYAVTPPFTKLAGLTAPGVDPDPAECTRTVEWIAGLTAVDGATIINSRYDLLGFGAKIVRRRGSHPVEQVMATEPVQGMRPSLVNPSELGGTRHLSAAQFVHDQHKSIALVASQDGRFTVFEWSPCEDNVHAHRVEMLLR
ncbi:MAG: putative sensor domain DACNV-containing protein [Candidatus Solibacter sp.]